MPLSDVKPTHLLYLQAACGRLNCPFQLVSLHLECRYPLRQLLQLTLRRLLFFLPHIVGDLFIPAMFVHLAQ